MRFKKDSLHFYVCPACRADLILRQEFLICTSPECRRKYYIVNLIPNLIADLGTVMDLKAYDEMMKN